MRESMVYSGASRLVIISCLAIAPLVRKIVEIVSTHTVREGGGFKVRRPSRNE